MYAHGVNASEVSLADSEGGRAVSADLTTPGRFDNKSESNEFYGMGRNDTMESIVRDEFTHWSRGAAHPSTQTTRDGRHAATSPLFPRQAGLSPGTEVVYWSFAHFSGHYEIDESMIKPAEFEDVKRRLAFGDGLTCPSPAGTPRLMGGGELGQLDSAEGDVAHISSAGWGSYLRQVIGGQTPANASGGSHRRSSSTMLDASTRVMTSKTIPLFSSPPSIVAVDLQLAPGESKTFTFSLRLPADLPPSFMGSAIKFTYNLVIGTNRMDTSRAAAHLSHQRSRLIKIPLRLYNHVGPSEVRPFFDLTNPVVLSKEQAVVQEEKSEEGGDGASKRWSASINVKGRQPSAQESLNLRRVIPRQGESDEETMTSYLLIPDRHCHLF